MSKTNKTPSVSEIQVSSSINVNQTEIIQVAISEIEEKLISRRHDLTEEVKGLDSLSTKLDKDLTNQLNKEAKTKFEADAKTLEKAIKAFKKNMTMEATFSGCMIKNDKTGKQEVKYSCTCSFATAPYSGSTTIDKDTMVAKPSKEVSKLLKDIENNKALIDAAISELREVKQSLNNMGRYERRAKARLAEITLTSNDEGKQLLDDLRSGVFNDSFLKSLPELT